jgi:putative spermidine/putrescine transport system permease protein
MMPRSTWQLLLGWGGRCAVLIILCFLLLPAVVVTIAAFNDKPILSFPPQAWSWRWFARALAYQDFRDGFRNGLIVTAWSSVIALVVGAMFAFVIDRYQFRLKRAIEAVLLSPLVIPHFTVGLGFLILAAGSAGAAASRSSSPAT